jgi:hydrogenase nickel incorporation protein HypB
MGLETGTRTIVVRESVTGANDRIAERIRSLSRDRRILVLNLISSPGAGKTALIEKTVRHLKTSVLVIEGDPYTALDTERVSAAGATGIQINTRGGCHLDARMIEQALEGHDLSGTRLVIIENVGNLLCPAAWDLGQDSTVVIAGLTEGADKPLKYPDAFLRADVLVINKTDLKPYLPESCSLLRPNALGVNPDLTVFETSCLSESGLDEWYRWVRDSMDRKGKDSVHA